MFRDIKPQKNQFSDLHKLHVTKSVIAADKAHAASSVERDFEKEHKDEMQRLCDKIEALQEE